MGRGVLGAVLAAVVIAAGTSPAQAAGPSGHGGGHHAGQQPVWIPGAVSPSGAQANCGLTSFTGGPVSLTQWVGRFDGDYSC